MRRLVIVGATGAGKSTLAEQLSELLKCPFIELDALFWKPGWNESSEVEFHRKVDSALRGESWVVSGNYRVVRDIVWSRADTLIWLDFPLYILLWRLLRRTIRRVASKELLWGTNQERFSHQFLSRDSLFLWAVKSQQRHKIEYPMLFELPENRHLQIFHFHRPAELSNWMNKLIEGAIN